MRRRYVALTLLAAVASSCASTVVPADGNGYDGRAATRDGGTGGDAGLQLTRCGRDTVHDGDRCETVHDSCLVNLPCGGYTACDCGVDGLWHCQTVACTNDGGR